MTDLGVLAELALLLAVPVIPLIAGAMLRRRFAPHADGTPLTAAQKRDLVRLLQSATAPA